MIRANRTQHLQNSEQTRWLDRIAAKFDQPMIAIARQLHTPQALEHEIARLFVECARDEAHALFREKETPSDEAGLLHSLIRHEYAKLRSAQAEQQAREAQAMIAQLKAESAQ